jgi:hypothetical protein
MAQTTVSGERPRYTDIGALRSAGAKLAGVEIRSPADEVLGRLMGVLLTAESGRSRYLVVDATSAAPRRRYVIPAGG